MGKSTAISWTDHTFNPWIGCQKVSPGCDHCYAEAQDKRFTGGQHWGPHAPRRRTSDANWRQPLAWNRAAERAGTRRRVFCASLADVFDNQVPPLDWLLLTKRPQHIAKMLPGQIAGRPWPWPNVWLGTTAENQAEADRRVPHLLSVPAVVHFLSCEPLLGPLSPDLTGIDWVICGGESGAGARPMHPDWARGLRDQCARASVPLFFKQWGEWLPCYSDMGDAGAVCFPDDGRDDSSLDDFPARPVRTIGGQEMWRIGKHAAGDLLDGVRHHAWPEVRHG